MIRAELYIPINTVQVKGYTHSEIQGVPVPSKGMPFRDGHISQFSAVGKDASDSKQTLRKISSIHGRSYEFVTGRENAIVWADEFGNIFTQINTKGNNVSDPEVRKSESAPSEFLFYGLQDSDSMVRVLKASELLRSRNIETEIIFKVIEPEELPFNGEILPVSEVKRRLVQKVWEDSFTDEKKSPGNRATKEDIPKISLALDKTIFFITARGTQVNERLADLGKASSIEEALPMIRNAFRYVNLAEKTRALKDRNYSLESFDINNRDDIVRYFNEYLPKSVAINLSGLHKEGLAIGSSHTANISTVGSIYDLDSVVGESLGLGDKSVTIDDFVDDVTTFLYLNGNFPNPEDVIGKFVDSNDLRFRENLLRNYINEMGWTGSVSHLGYICRLFSYFPEYSDEEKVGNEVDFYFEKAVENLDFYPLIDPSSLQLFVQREVEGWEESARKNLGQEQINALFKEIIGDLVASSLQRKYEALNEERPDRYNPDFELFGNRYAKKKAEEVLGSDTSDNTLDSKSKIDEYKLIIYKKLFKHVGWEDNLIEHIGNIDDLFDSFITASSSKYLEHYCTLLIRQLGLDFNLESLEEMIAKFHKYDQGEVRERIEKALKDNLKGKNRTEIVENAIRPDNGQENFTTDHEPRYSRFLNLYIDNMFEQSKSNELLQAAGRYGKKAIETAVFWLRSIYFHRYIDSLSSNDIEKLEQVTGARIEELKEQYLQTA